MFLVAHWNMSVDVLHNWTVVTGQALRSTQSCVYFERRRHGFDITIVFIRG